MNILTFIASSHLPMIFVIIFKRVIDFIVNFHYILCQSYNENTGYTHTVLSHMNIINENRILHIN